MKALAAALAISLFAMSANTQNASETYEDAERKVEEIEWWKLDWKQYMRQYMRIMEEHLLPVKYEQCYWVRKVNSDRSGGDVKCLSYHQIKFENCKKAAIDTENNAYNPEMWEVCWNSKFGLARIEERVETLGRQLDSIEERVD